MLKTLLQNIALRWQEYRDERAERLRGTEMKVARMNAFRDALKEARLEARKERSA